MKRAGKECHLTIQILNLDFFKFENVALVKPHKLEESTMEKQTIWTIPNILTLSRISCTPILCALVHGGQYKYAFIGLCIAGFSDWLDGFLARHLNQQTVFGSLIDPVADKILITSLALTEGYRVTSCTTGSFDPT